MRTPLISLASLAGAAMASPLCNQNKTSTTLFVSSYAGNITSLSLTKANGKYSLSEISANDGCLTSPSWLTLDYKEQTLYCLDEGLTTTNGSLSSYAIQADGSLESLDKQSTISGPVSGAIYGNTQDVGPGKKGLALAHYTGSSVSGWELANSTTADFTHLQDLTFTLSKPGAVPSRQDAPHIHEAINDPTGQYILTPDLGSDLVHVFSHDTDLKLTPLTSLEVAPGYGPRHATFYLPNGRAGENETTFFYLVGELSNNVTGYSVTYKPNKGGLDFTKIYESTTYGNAPAPAGNAAAEIALSPDNRFLTISNRNNSQILIDNPDPTNSTKVFSDTLTTFSLAKDGQLTFGDAYASGGSYPRQFSLNAAGDLVAVGLQYGSAVVILERNVQSGAIGPVVAYYPIEGQVTCSRWNEPVFDGTYANAV